MEVDSRTSGHKRKGPEPPSPAVPPPSHRRTQIPQNLRKMQNPGSGNCLFHCFAQAETVPGKVRSHRQLRAFIVSHMTKHWNKFKEFWDGLGPDNLPMTGDFSDYVKQVGLDKSWGGYCEIAAYAAATSRPVLVVHARDEMVHAFNPNATQHAVVLYYHNEHYELVLPSDEQLQAIWQNAEEAGLGEKKRSFRGAAKSTSPGLSDFASVRGTIQKTKGKKPSSSVYQTPKANQASPRLSDFATPAKRSARLTDFASERCSGAPTNKRHEFQSSGSRPSVEAFSTKAERKITWSCHICEFSFTGAVKWVCVRRSNHMRYTHPDVPASAFTTVKKRVQVTPVSYEKTDATVTWTCGFCKGTLPSLPKAQLTASIREHLRQCQKAPKDATRNDSIRMLCKKMRMPPEQHRTSILPKLLKLRQMYQDLNKFAKSQGHSLSQVRQQHRHIKSQGGVFLTSQHACSICAGYWTSAKEVREAGPCHGRSSRTTWLDMPGRHKCWRQSPKERQEELSKAWRLSSAERRKLDNAQAKAQANAKKKARRKWPPKAWKRDLTAENVHPHPGPCSHGQWILSWNCHGINNAWKGLNMLRDTGAFPAILCLQEPDFEPRQGLQYLAKLQHLGYKCWTIPAKCTSNGNRVFHRGGLVVAVNQSIRGGVWATLDCQEGYAITLDLESCLLTTVWRRPSEVDGSQFLDYAAPVSEEAQRRQIPSLWIGDWNQPPDHNVFSLSLNSTTLAVTDSDTWIPSRFGGNRCIDYALATCHDFADSPCYSDCKISDHKMFWLRMRLPLFQNDTWNFAWRPKYECPAGLPTEQWQSALAAQWETYTPCFSSNPDQDWYYFHTFAEKASRESLLACGQPVPKFGHARGSLPRVVKSERPQATTFRARKIVNTLGRLYEVKRQLAASQVDPDLLRKLWKTWPPDSNHLWGQWDHAIAELEVILAKQKQQSRNARIAQWRARMRRGGKEVTRWMKPVKPLTPLIVADDPHATVTQTLDHVRQYWQKIWKRDNCIASLPLELNLHAALSGPNSDWMPDAALIHQVARASAGSGAGCDGWSGNEICHWPISAWEHYRCLVLHWSKLNRYPQAWHQVRQVHLRKTDDEVPDGSVPVETMRPIAVESIFLRVVSSAYVKSPQVQEWILSRVPDQCHGSIKQRGVATAWRQLNEAFERKEVLVSLDFSKCFDYVHPSLAIQNMHKQGLPDEWARILLAVWGHQVRWLCLGRNVHPTPEHVHTSMPQGDAFAPIALILLLAKPCQDVSDLPRVRQVAYVDDRAIAAPSVQTLLAGIDRWRSWSAKLGLKENVQKMQFVACAGRHKQELVDLGYGEHVRPSAKILGIDFRESVQVESNSLQKRLCQAVQVAHRLCLIPVPRAQKMQLYRSRVVSLATWGGWFDTLPSDVLPKLRRAWHSAASLQQQASRPLFNLLSGHGHNAEFWATVSSIRTMRQVQVPWRQAARPGGWQDFICAQMSKMQWHSRGQWVFAHAELGQVDLSNQDQADLSDHQVRESLRRSQWDDWKKQNRRDSHLLRPDVSYCEIQVTAARKMFSCTTTGHERAVMLGAALSSACYDRMRKQEIRQTCPFCCQQIPPVWDHLSWHCTSETLSNGRPDRPVDALQSRLGWPSGGGNQYDVAVLQHLARIRALVRETM